MTPEVSTSPLIHVMHVVPTLGAGGMELAMLRVIKALSGSGMRHTVVALKGEPDLAERFAPWAEVVAMRSGANDLRLPFRLRRLIRAICPDVIHARNWGAWPDVVAGTLLSGARPPVVFSFHGFRSTTTVPLRRKLACRLLSLTTRRCFAVSPAARDLMARQMWVPRRQIELIPNGVDLRRFSPGNLPRRENGSFRLGTVGSLTPVKNHAMLLRAAAKVVQQGGDLQVRIAGDGPLREDLQALSRQLGMEDRVDLPGWVDDVPGFLHSLDAFVLPSRTEAHPNALIEAMACGLPCAGARAGGIPWVLQDGQVGPLFGVDDDQALAVVMERWLEDPVKTAETGREARRHAEATFDFDEMVQRYASLYTQAASGVRRNEGARPHTPRVAMLGPLPPPVGGMAVVCEGIRSSPRARQAGMRTIHTGKTTREGRPLWAGIAAQGRLLGHILRAVWVDGAELLHIHTCSGFAFWRDALLALAGRVSGARCLLHIHGGGFARFAAGLPGPAQYALRWVLESADGVIVLGRRWLDALRPFAPRARWFIIPNGVAVPADPPAAQDREPICLFLGTFTPAKGARDLVSAWGRIASGHPEWTLILAGGETEPGQRETIVQAIEAAGLAGRVQLPGVVVGEAKGSLFRRSAVFVLPSHVEAMPMALLEAMSFGLAVVASDVGAVGEVVSEGQNGLLVPPGDVDVLADALERLLDRSDLRERLGSAGQRRIRETFGQDVMVARLFDAYNAVKGG